MTQIKSFTYTLYLLEKILSNNIKKVIVKNPNNPKNKVPRFGIKLLEE